MTKITFFRDGGVYYGFEEVGHTGYAEEGEDILCASLSAMTMFLINTIEVAFASDVTYDINEDDTRVTVRSRAALPQFEADERKRYAVSGVFLSYFYQLNDMTVDYPDYLSVDVKDVGYDASKS